MENNLLNQVLTYLKDNKCFYDINEELITVNKGTFNVFIQLEKYNDTKEYDFFAIWIQDDSDWNKAYEDEYNANHPIDSVEGVLTNAFERVQEINKQIQRLSNLFNEIETLVNEHSIPLDVVDQMYQELNFN